MSTCYPIKTAMLTPDGIEAEVLVGHDDGQQLFMHLFISKTSPVYCEITQMLNNAFSVEMDKLVTTVLDRPRKEK